MAREERGLPGRGVTGSWSYTGADGRQVVYLQYLEISINIYNIYDQVEMKFVADKFGYRPDSSNLHIAHR